MKSSAEVPCNSTAVHSGVDVCLPQTQNILLACIHFFPLKATKMSFTMAIFTTHFSSNDRIFVLFLVGKGGISILDLLPPNVILPEKKNIH